MVFEELAPFTKRVMDLLEDEELAGVQGRLLARPDAGKVIPGIRWAAEAAGAWRPKAMAGRGGARIIYYWVVARDRILMLDIYAKNEKEDLSAGELKQLRTLIEDYRA